MIGLWWACAPRLPVGEVPVERAAAPARLVEAHDPAVPNVYLAALVRAGSAFDPPGKEGRSALTARAAVEAGAGDRTADEVRDALYPTGNALSVVVDREWISVRLRCPAAQIDVCVELFADALVRPAFHAADVARLRDELRYDVGAGLLDDEERLAHEVLDAVLYEGRPYGHPVEGREGTLVDAADCIAWHGRAWVREAVVVGIAGNFPATARDRLVERLGDLPGSLAPELLLPAPPTRTGRSLVAVDTDTPVTGFSLGHALALDRNHADWPALHLAMTAFGAHRQSFGRLFRTLRTARGLNYGDYAYVEPYVQRGGSPMPENGVLRSQNRFELWARPTGQDNGPFALKLAVDELERLVADGLTAAEVDDTRAYLAGSVPLLAQDPGRRLLFEMDAVATGTPNLLTELVPALGALDEAAVDAAIRRHLRPAELVMVGVTGDASGLVDVVVEGKPTPIVYRDVVPDALQSQRDAAVAGIDLGLNGDDAWTVSAEGVFR